MLRTLFQVFVGKDESQDNLFAHQQHQLLQEEQEQAQVDVEAPESMESGTTTIPRKRRKIEAEPHVIELERKLSGGLKKKTRAGNQGAENGEEPDDDLEDKENSQQVPLSQGTLLASQKSLKIFVDEAGAPLRFFVPEEMTFSGLLKDLISKHGGEVAPAATEDVICLSDKPVEGNATYNPDLIYRSIAEDQLIFLGSFLHTEKAKKPTLTAFTQEEDNLLFESALHFLDDGHYEPGENLFKLLVEKKILRHSWEDLRDRYEQLLEEPVYKKRRFEFTLDLDRVRSPRKSLTPPKAPLPKKGALPLGKDDTEAYKSLHQQAAAVVDQESELVETEEEGSSRSEPIHQPQLFDDTSLDGSASSSIDGDSDREADETSFEQVEQAVKKLEILSKKPRDTVLHALYVCNGEVSLAKDYLLKGPKAVVGKTWSREEDLILQGSDPSKISQLERKRGKVAVESRLKFIHECV